MLGEEGGRVGLRLQHGDVVVALQRLLQRGHHAVFHEELRTSCHGFSTSSARKSLTLVKVGPVTTGRQRREEAVGVVAVEMIARAAGRAHGRATACRARRWRRRCPRCRRCRRCRPPARQVPGSPCSAMRARQQELGGAAAAAGRAAAHRHGGLAAGEDHAGPREGLAMPRHRARQRGVHLAHLARLALDLVGQHVRVDAGAARQRGGCLAGCAAAWPRGAPRGRRSAASPGFGSRRRRFEALARGGRHVDAVAREDAQRVGAGGRVGHRGAAGDHGRVVAGHVADRAA